MNEHHEHSKNFYAEASKCPFIQKTFKECPFFKKQVDECPFLKKTCEENQNKIKIDEKEEELPPLMSNVNEQGLLQPSLGEAVDFYEKGRR